MSARLILLLVLLGLAGCAAPQRFEPDRDGGIGGTGAPALLETM